MEIEIDINEVEDININALTPKQKALRLNALVKLAQGSVFTNHDFEEALTLTRQLMKRQDKMTKCNDCGRKIDEDTLGFIAYEICLSCYLEQQPDRFIHSPRKVIHRKPEQVIHRLLVTLLRIVTKSP